MERPIVTALIILLVAIAGFVSFRQIKNIRWLRAQEQISTEDISYHRWLIFRRFLGCGLMLLLAGMLTWMYTAGYADRLDELLKLGEQVRGTGQKLTEEQSKFLYSAMTYVGCMLIVLLVLIMMMIWDMAATRKYGLRHNQRIRSDRRAMLERQLPILMAERKMKKEIKEPPGEGVE